MERPNGYAPSTISGILICSHLSTAKSLHALFEQTPSLNLQSILFRPPQLPSQLAGTPEIVFVDADCWQRDRQRRISALAKALSAATILFTDDMMVGLVVPALRHGVQGFMRYTTPPRDLARAAAVRAGELWVPRRMLYQALEDTLDDAAEPLNGADELAMLSAREREIVLKVQEGLCNKEIARSLGISHKTVKTHLQHIFRKTDIHSRLKLAILRS